MKKTRIIKIIQQTKSNDFNGMIIIPITPLNFTNHSIRFVKEILNESFSTPKKIIKKKENEIIEQITTSINVIEIYRNFNILISDQMINISETHLLSNDEKLNIENYLKDFKDKIKSSNISSQFTHLIFEYNITFKICEKNN
jgi:hypothetical protein